CDAGAYDYDNGDIDKIPAYCIIREWHKRERAARNLAPFSGIAYVRRSIPTGSDRPTDFDVYSGGADLHIAAATLNATGDVTMGADKSVTSGCGLDPSTADIRRPSVSWDGKLIAFAARASASDPLEIYQMNADGSSCAKLDAIDAGDTTGNGLLIHNFDPVYSPPGADGVMRIVFASTRGNTNNPGAYDYTGPQRMPSDPTKSNSDLFVLEPDPNSAGQTRVRQLTYQLDMEREPSFMSDGRIIFTSEKREQDFYELALRRIDLDGSDYHPLYSQRGSIGYYEATNVIELADKNFMTILSNPGVPHNGGALGVFNRSIGVDFTSANPADYATDPTVIDPNSATSVEPDFFLHSLFFPDASVSGVPGQPTTGVYCSPSMLPDGKALVSFGAAGDAGAFGGDYDIYEIDPVSGTKSAVLIGCGGTAEVDAVGIFARNSRGIFASALDEPNSYNNIVPNHSEAD
ncbi:MAG: TolB family protein, partial [Polyangiaceae bacterium]